MPMPSMTAYNFGDVILVPFPFTDQSQAKQRPAVIVSSARYNTERPDLILMAITSQVRSPATFGEVIVQHWQVAQLLKISAIKPVFTTLDKRSCANPLADSTRPIALPLKPPCSSSSAEDSPGLPSAVEPRRAAPAGPATHPRFGPKSSRPSILHSTHRPSVLDQARRRLLLSFPTASTCIRLLALAYPAITKSRPKMPALLMHTEGIWPKVRQPNFSSSIHCH